MSGVPLAIYTISLDTSVARLYSAHNPGIMKEFHENLISLAFEIGQPNQAICLITFSVVKITSQAYNWQKIDVAFENKSQFIKVSESKVALECWCLMPMVCPLHRSKWLKGKSSSSYCISATKCCWWGSKRDCYLKECWWWNARDVCSMRRHESETCLWNEMRLRSWK